MSQEWTRWCDTLRTYSRHFQIHLFTQLLAAVAGEAATFSSQGASCVSFGHFKACPEVSKGRCHVPRTQGRTIFSNLPLWLSWGVVTIVRLIGFDLLALDLQTELPGLTVSTDPTGSTSKCLSCRALMKFAADKWRQRWVANYCIFSTGPRVISSPVSFVCQVGVLDIQLAVYEYDVVVRPVAAWLGISHSHVLLSHHDVRKWYLRCFIRYVHWSHIHLKSCT